VCRKVLTTNSSADERKTLPFHIKASDQGHEASGFSKKLDSLTQLKNTDSGVEAVVNTFPRYQHAYVVDEGDARDQTTH
jgi:hypothetical protein